MEKLTVALLLIAGFIKILPLSGVLGADRLGALYGMPFEGRDLLILMQHRAVLFGLLGGFILLSAWQPVLRPYAIGAGLISALAFIALAWARGGFNAQILRAGIADLVVIAACAGALVLHLARRQA